MNAREFLRTVLPVDCMTAIAERSDLYTRVSIAMTFGLTRQAVRAPPVFMAFPGFLVMTQDYYFLKPAVYKLFHRTRQLYGNINDLDRIFWAPGGKSFYWGNYVLNNVIGVLVYNRLSPGKIHETPESKIILPKHWQTALDIHYGAPITSEHAEILLKLSKLLRFTATPKQITEILSVGLTGSGQLFRAVFETLYNILSVEHVQFLRQYAIQNANNLPWIQVYYGSNMDVLAEIIKLNKYKDQELLVEYSYCNYMRLPELIYVALGFGWTVRIHDRKFGSSDGDSETPNSTGGLLNLFQFYVRTPDMARVLVPAMMRVIRPIKIVKIVARGKFRDAESKIATLLAAAGAIAKELHGENYATLPSWGVADYILGVSGAEELANILCPGKKSPVDSESDCDSWEWLSDPDSDTLEVPADYKNIAANMSDNDDSGDSDSDSDYSSLSD